MKFIDTEWILFTFNGRFLITNSNDSDMRVTVEVVVEALRTVQDLGELVDIFLGHL